MFHLSTDAYPKPGFGNGMDTFTVAYWVNPSSGFSGNGRVLGNFNDGSSTCIQIGINDAGAARLYLREEGNVAFNADTPSNTVPFDTWSHIAVSYSGTQVTYFLNGTMIQQSNVSILTNFVSWQYPNGIPCQKQQGNHSGAFLWCY